MKEILLYLPRSICRYLDPWVFSISEVIKPQMIHLIPCALIANKMQGLGRHNIEYNEHM